MQGKLRLIHLHDPILLRHLMEPHLSHCIDGLIDELIAVSHGQKGGFVIGLEANKRYVDEERPHASIVVLKSAHIPEITFRLWIISVSLKPRVLQHRRPEQNGALV